MGDFGIHAHVPVDKPTSVFSMLTNAIIGKMSDDKPVVHLIGRRAETVIFDIKIGSGIIVTTQEKFQRMLSDRSFVPIPLREIRNKAEAGTLTPQEVIFVKVDDLARMGLQSTQVKSALSKEGIDTNLRLLQVSKGISSALETKVFFSTIRETLITKWSETIDPQTIEKAATFVTDHPKVNLTPEQSDKLFLARTGGSNTIQTDPNKKQDWLNGDQFIRQKAQSQEKLTLEDLCKLNSLLNGADNDEIGGGQLRDHIVQVGGPGGPSYVHHNDVPTLLNEVLDDINNGIEKGENPVVLASKAFQRMVSVHPFSDGNGGTCRLVMDYVLLKAGLPPPSLGKDVNFGIFGDQPLRPGMEPPLCNPTLAVQKTIEGIQNSYNTINT